MYVNIETIFQRERETVSLASIVSIACFVYVSLSAATGK